MASSLRRRRSGRKNKRQRAPSAPTPPSRTRSHSEPEASRVDTTSDEESYAAHHKKQSRKFKKKIEDIKMRFKDKRDALIEKKRRLGGELRERKRRIGGELREKQKKLREKQKKIGSDIDRGILNMKNNIRKLSLKRFKGKNERRSARGSSRSGSELELGFSDEADVEFEDCFSDEGHYARSESRPGSRKMPVKTEKKIIKRWKAWRERHKERRSRHSENMNSVIGAPDLLDFLAQDGSNMFVRQLQRLNRRIDVIQGRPSDSGVQNSPEGLDGLAPELRILVLTETWDRLSGGRKRRLLRVKPSFVITPLERCLCSTHKEAVSCLVRTRSVSELLPGYVESRTGQWWRMRNDDDTLHDRLARAMMGRNFFSELQKSPERKCPMCTDAKKDREREMGHLVTHSDDDSGSTSSGGIVARRRFVEVERRSLRQVLLDDSGLICQYLAYCTRAIIGYRVYACLVKRWVDPSQGRRRRPKLSISNMKLWPKILSETFRANLKSISFEHSRENIPRGERSQRGLQIKTVESAQDAIPDEFMCAICVDLLCKPCELACGHKFCKVCLLRIAVTQQEKFISCLCPFCRRPFFFDDLKESPTIVAALTNLYPAEYNVRVEETAEGEKDLLQNVVKRSESFASNEISFFPRLICSLPVIFLTIGFFTITAILHVLGVK